MRASGGGVARPGLCVLPRTPLPALRWTGSDQNTNPGSFVKPVVGRFRWRTAGPLRTFGIPPGQGRTSLLPPAAEARGVVYRIRPPPTAVRYDRVPGAHRLPTGRDGRGARARRAYLCGLYGLSGTSGQKSGAGASSFLSASRASVTSSLDPDHGGALGHGSIGRLLPRSGAEEICINPDRGGTVFSAGSPRGPCPGGEAATEARLPPGW